MENEEFDISGEIDKSSPIFKFYEKELANYKESAAEYGLTTQYMDKLKSLTSGKWDKEIKPKLS